MLDGSKLIITPREGGGFEVHEEDPVVSSNEVLAAIGMAVVLSASIWGILTLADALTDRLIKKPFTDGA